MKAMLFARITKIDEAKREVWGRATQEVPDNTGEIYDYASSKPYVEAWSQDFEKMTGGKSLGNIRAMHGNVAAGKAIAVEFNDVEKAVDIGTKIVDDNEWQKCLEGVYTGFSIGGRYVRKWTDPVNKALTRFTAKLGEISLADKPCVPSATFFEIVKTDGTLAKAAFKPREEAAVLQLAAKFQDGSAKPSDVLALLNKTVGSVGKSYSDTDEYVTADDVTDDDRPDDVPLDEWEEMDDEEKAQAVNDSIDAEKTAKGTMSKVAKPDNIEQDKWDKMTPQEQAAAVKAPPKKEDEPAEKNTKVEAKARELCKAAHAGDESKWQGYVGPAIRELAKAEFTPPPEPVAKTEVTVDDAIKVLQALSERVQIAKMMDDPRMTAEKFDAIAVKVLGEDGIAKVSINGTGIREALKGAILEKYGARNSSTDLSNLQKAHDAIIACGASCPMPQDNGNGVIGVTAVKTDASELAKTVAALQAEVQRLKDEPVRKGRTRAPIGLSKSQDNGDGAVDDKDKVIKSTPGQHNPEAALDMIKTMVEDTSPLRKF